MISVVVVILNRLQEFLDIFIESLLEKSKHISEVIIVNVEEEERDIASWTSRGINFKLIGGNQHIFGVNCPTAFCAQHAFGLHLGLEKTTNEYIMFSDPDMFFYSDVDECYLSLMKEHNLNFIGICRPAAICHNIAFFPTIVNCLVKKSDLPPKDFAKEMCPLNKILNVFSDDAHIPTYLYPMVMEAVPEDIRNKFPNPTGHYETGTKLFLWALEKNWRWLSYQTTDQNNYYKNLYRNNFGFKLKYPREKLLYHESLSSTCDKLKYFKQAYKK